jgi:hypothetical protein
MSRKSMLKWGLSFVAYSGGDRITFQAKCSHSATEDVELHACC